MSVRFFTVCLCLIPTAAAQDSAVKVKSPEWLRGSWTKLQIRIQGEVLNKDGSPATDFQFAAILDNQPLEAKVSGNRFEFWVPVGKQQWLLLQLEATGTKDRTLIASRWLQMMQLRNCAQEGVKLTLQPADRPTAVTVTYKGKLVSGATVSARTMSGRATRAKTNDRGVATLLLMDREELFLITAWTDDFRVGGFHLSREPKRDSRAAAYAIELEECRPQKVRLLDTADGTPIPDVTFELVIGTGEPNYQFVGRTPDWLLTSDARGEAICRWFPDWKTQGSYIELKANKWSKVGNPKMQAGVLTANLKEGTSRRRMKGQLTAANPEVSVAGLCVHAETFQTDVENQIEMMYAFTNARGEFFLDYRKGSTYVISVSDQRLASKTITIMPCSADSDETQRPTLAVVPAIPIRIKATLEGEPVRHEMVYLGIKSELNYVENGEPVGAIAGRRWRVVTDKAGEARAYIHPDDRLEASIDIAGKRIRSAPYNGVILLEGKSAK